MRELDWSYLCDDAVGHDSQLDGIQYDAVAGSFVLHLQCYLEEASADRKPVKVQFTDVRSVVTHLDGSALLDHRGPGNVNYWEMREGAGTSIIFLCGGYIAITSDKSPGFSRG